MVFKFCSRKGIQDGLAGADPGFFLGGGALVSYSTSTPINHIVLFCFVLFVAEYQLYWKTAGHLRGGAHPLHPPPRSAPVLDYGIHPFQVLYLLLMELGFWIRDSGFESLVGFRIPRAGFRIQARAQSFESRLALTHG